MNWERSDGEFALEKASAAASALRAAFHAEIP
jgi:hypothetical protein